MTLPLAQQSSGSLPRPLPTNLDAEANVISCCVLDGADTIGRCIDAGLSPPSFSDPRHAIIFEVLLDLHRRNQPVDAAILAEELRTQHHLESIGGIAFLSATTNRIPTTAQAAYFIEKVREAALLRNILRAASSVAERCYDFSGSIDEFVDQAEAQIFQVTQQRVSQAAQPASRGVAAAMGVIQKMLAKRGELTGVSSGLKDLDNLLWGFQQQEMIVLAARPSVGKTALALNFLEAAALPERGEGVPALMFSLEMGASQLALRLLCSRARVNLKLLRDGLISSHGEESQRLNAAASDFSRAPIFIDDSSALSIMQLRAKARRIHSRTPLGFIIVDYLQLLSPTDPRVPREQQVAEASRGLKQLAKELDVPVLVLSQLNRSSEKESRSPRLADLRESGSIEQDADVVLMLARPKDADEKFQVAADTADLIVAKQRNGPVGEVKLTFQRDITRFSSYAV